MGMGLSVRYGESMQMKRVEVAILEGAPLDWAVAAALKLNPHMARCALRGGIPPILTDKNDLYWEPTECWSDGGEIFDKYGVSIECLNGDTWAAGVVCDGEIQINGYGTTKLIAICRAIVLAKIGQVIDIPERLFYISPEFYYGNKD
jgi:hypothetical protein